MTPQMRNSGRRKHLPPDAPPRPRSDRTMVPYPSLARVATRRRNLESTLYDTYTCDIILGSFLVTTTVAIAKICTLRGAVEVYLKCVQRLLDPKTSTPHLKTAFETTSTAYTMHPR